MSGRARGLDSQPLSGYRAGMTKSERVIIQDAVQLLNDSEEFQSGTSSDRVIAARKVEAARNLLNTVMKAPSRYSPSKR